MANQNAQSSINEFKQFIKRHPKLISEVRKQEKSWQEVYENWVLLGEDDSIWDPYREKEASAENEPDAGDKNDFISKMVTAVRKMDANQMNEQINKMSQSISSLQSLLSQFSSGSQKQQNQSGGEHPFSFRKD
ncbi:YlbD family protein [Bacillus haynesii]|uniref:YlbD family protein n=1 Tax=Bacillus haynesii TaxID=1925021 RepID=UPI00227DC168|nr:YlbD family protein [Bacillus haynesii]MCY7770528.1 YlbD family protein [Bacillus haynesii]MCY7850760.1 YlbD family protein [Bacillus haynesii]MCY7860773.1 YlbD family protein [Bacillus haynesii]MCY7912459.1 YlbD family protein [Bacillus haynesii]MCY7925134.1 YlbD family protein [Bacillus haynesii]